MKIIFEFHGKDPQCTAQGFAYESPVREKPRWRGMRIEGLINDSSQAVEDEDGNVIKPFYDGDAFYIEGDLESIRKAFSEFLEMLDIVEEEERNRFEKKIARSIQCAKCGAHYDPTVQVDGGWHGDGFGNKCTGP